MQQQEINLGRVLRSAYQDAVNAGYTGTESEFYAALATMKNAPFLSLAGGEMTGNLLMKRNSLFFGEQNDTEIKELSGQRGITIEIGGPGTEFYSGGGIGNVPEPNNEKDVVNKKYADRLGVPLGGIIMWSGASNAIPTGWAICDGKNGTPDLRDKFIVGAGSTHRAGTTGGNASVQLSEDNLPAHSHAFSNGRAASAGSHTHGNTFAIETVAAHKHTVHSVPADNSYFVITSANNSDGRNLFGVSVIGSEEAPVESAGAHTHTLSGSVSSGGSHTHTVTGTIGSTGSGNAFSILPPYYALCFIMRVV